MGTCVARMRLFSRILRGEGGGENETLVEVRKLNLLTGLVSRV